MTILPFTIHARSRLGCSLGALALLGVFVCPWAAAANKAKPDAYAAVARGDYAVAHKLWTDLAKKGNAEAQYNLGVMYANGDGVGKNPAAALNWFRQAAKQGNAKAQYNLGVMYANGDGVASNDTEAVKWLRQSAQKGLAKAQYSLGLMYQEGYGVGKDAAAAEKWFRLAAKQGDAAASRGLEALHGHPSPRGIEIEKTTRPETPRTVQDEPHPKQQAVKGKRKPAPPKSVTSSPREEKAKKSRKR